ncbi:hypothetical protein N7535_008734 [Penicillium sp. DV-2018c]|nr:hypothetical protein N7461_002491 [Penicillium sp. DV-2018c]KAJ5563570.1 hypothetical protein N7535_008734 [Penicillium sp. DV-2018c]
MIAKDLAAFVVGDGHPRTSMFLYVLDKRLLESIGAEEDTLVIHAFDANGEVHGREAFKWALELPGAIDQTGLTTLKGVADLQAKAVGVKGTMKQFWSPLLIEEVTERTITRCMEWFSEIQQLGGSVSSSTYLAFELLCSRDSIGSSSECAWPRPAGSKHVLLLGPGCSVDAGVEEEDVARQLAIKAPEEILGKGADIHLLPAGVEDFHDVRNVS